MSSFSSSTIPNSMEIKLAYIIGLVVIFFLSPITSVLLQFVFLIYTRNKSKVIYGFYLLSFSVMLGVINSTKIPASDMIYYVQTYKNIGSYSDILSYATKEGVEPIYYVLTYLIYFITGGAENQFIIIFTTVVYFLPLSALYYIARSLELKPIEIQAILMFYCLFTPLFNISFHLNRQVLAGSLIAVGFSVNILRKELSKYWLITAFFTHSSSILFGLVFIIKKYLAQKVSVFKLFLVSIFSFLMFSYLPDIGGVLNKTNVDTLAYVGKRASQKTFHELDGLSSLAYLMLILSLISILYNTYSKKQLPATVSPAMLNILYSMLGFIVSFVIMASLSPNTGELAGRFLFYIYFLLPISLTVNLYISKYSTLIGLVLVVILPVVFWYNLNFGPWDYIDFDKSVLYPLWLPSK